MTSKGYGRLGFLVFLLTLIDTYEVYRYVGMERWQSAALSALSYSFHVGIMVMCFICASIKDMLDSKPKTKLEVKSNG